MALVAPSDSKLHHETPSLTAVLSAQQQLLLEERQLIVGVVLVLAVTAVEMNERVEGFLQRLIDASREEIQAYGCVSI